MKHAPRPWQHLYDNSRWRKLRLAHLRTHPLCVMCKEAGRVTAASVVDHVKAHKGNEALFWDQSNWQSLCKPCHDRHAQSRDRTGKTPSVIGLDGWPVTDRKELGLGDLSHPAWFKPLAVPLTIVCGPPASGKSTYVAQHKGEADVVIDLDAIAIKTFGKPVALLPKDLRLACIKARNGQLRDLMTGDASAPMAWLIVTEPEAHKRQWWDDTLKPRSIIVIATPEADCIARAKADTKQQRPADVASTIASWWQTYGPRPSEVVIRPESYASRA
jgi:hypothetical protein